jgi:acyl carrier protein
MRTLVEPRLRRLAAEQLGVAEQDLAPELSLTQDLAADSLDVAELTVAIEEELGVNLPEDILSTVHTWGALVDMVVSVAAGQLAAEADRAAPPCRVTARVVPARDGRPIERGGIFTPYLAEVLADDVRHLGDGARLDVVVAVQPGDHGAVQRVRAGLARLAAAGVDVRVQRELVGSRPRQPSAA